MIPGAEKQYLRTLQARGGWLSQKHGVDLQESAPCASNAQKVNVSLSWKKKKCQRNWDNRFPMKAEAFICDCCVLPKRCLNQILQMSTLCCCCITPLSISVTAYKFIWAASHQFHTWTRTKYLFFQRFQTLCPIAYRYLKHKERQWVTDCFFKKHFFLKWTACTILCFTH